MPPIPQGDTPQQKMQYATTIQGLATFYYDSQTRTWSGDNNRDDVKLVEVWQRGINVVYIHPGRNKFFPVSDPRLQIEWHDLALNPRTETIRKHHRVHPPMVVRRLPGWPATAAHQPDPPPGIRPKPQVAPFVWAEAGNVIGYTSKTKINHPTFNNLIDLRHQGRLGSLPSVYYWCGHKTNDHERLNNIGWDDRNGWQCLFFGNIPTEYVLYP